MEIETVRLDDNPTYIALSYEWAGPGMDDPSDFELSDEMDGPRITENLARALLFVVSKALSPGTRIWVDAICISQKDDAEQFLTGNRQLVVWAMIKASHKARDWHVAAQ